MKKVSFSILIVRRLKKQTIKVTSIKKKYLEIALLSNKIVNKKADSRLTSGIDGALV